MNVNTETLRAALASLMAPHSNPPLFGFVGSSSQQVHDLEHSAQQTHRQDLQVQPLQNEQPRQPREQEQADPHEQLSQQQQPLSSVKDALLSIREKLMSLQAKQQIQQDSIARQTMAMFSGSPSPVQQQQPLDEQPQQSPLQTVAINAQELERIQQQQQLLVSFLHKRLQLESKQQQLLLQHQQLQQQQPKQHQLGRETASDIAGDIVTNNITYQADSNSSSSVQVMENASTASGSSSSTSAATGSNSQMRALQNGDYTTIQLLKAAKLKPKVEGVCFDKFFKRWVAKKSGTKKVYFPVHKHGFDGAYDLAVQTRRVHLQNPKQMGSTENSSHTQRVPAPMQDEDEGEQQAAQRGSSVNRELETEALGQHVYPANAPENFACRKAVKEKSSSQLTCSESNEVCDAQGSAPEGSTAPRSQQQLQQQQEVENSGFASQPGDDSLREAAPTSFSLISSSPSPFDKKGSNDIPEQRASAAGACSGNGVLSQGPTVTEALHRLAVFRLDELNIESPVNPEKNPRDAIRVAEALAPFPSGIRFDKSTFRWFALFRDKATGAKRAKTFTAKMYEGCVVKAYWACLRFCSCHVIKPIEGSRPVLLDCTSGLALPDESLYSWRTVDGEPMRTPTRGPRDDMDGQDGRWRKQQQTLADEVPYEKRRAPWASQMDNLWQRSARSSNRRGGTEGGAEGASLKSCRLPQVVNSLGGQDGASPSRVGADYALVSPNAERESTNNSLALPPVDRDDFSEGNDLLEETLLPGRSSRRRSRRIAGGKRRRVQPPRSEENILGADGGERTAWSVSSVEHALMEGCRQYCQQSSSSYLPFSLSTSQTNTFGSRCCSCCSECEECSKQYQCSEVPFCLQCLPADTRQMLRQVLLICFDGVTDVVLSRSNFSKTDRWRRWLAVRRHRERVAEAAVWQADPQWCKDDVPEASRALSPVHGAPQAEDSTPAPGWDKQRQQQQKQKQHQCWGELIPYVHLFWPFIQHQEVPSNLEMCVVSELLQQLHALAAKKPQIFREYPLLSEEDRYEGDFSCKGRAADAPFIKTEEVADEADEFQQPFYTLGSGSPLYD